MDGIRNIPAWADNRDLVSGFTTRDFGSLSTRADSPESVYERYALLARHFDIDSERIFTLLQTHSNNVAIIRDRNLPGKSAGRRTYNFSPGEVYPGEIYLDSASFDMDWQRGVDGVILAVDGVYAVISTADCAPVMFWDAASRVCGIAHVGLVGAFNQLAVRMVSLMQQEFGIAPRGLDVAILPSIRGCHYNLSRSGVWQRMKDAILAKYGADNPHYANSNFDLPGFIRWQLETAGVDTTRITDMGICTVCEAQNFFSHVEAGFTGTQEREGRFGSIIGVRPVKQILP